MPRVHYNREFEDESVTLAYSFCSYTLMKGLYFSFITP